MFRTSSKGLCVELPLACKLSPSRANVDGLNAKSVRSMHLCQDSRDSQRLSTLEEALLRDVNFNTINATAALEKCAAMFNPHGVPRLCPHPVID